MDKRALQNYAVWAKNNLENQIEIALKTLGINSEKDIREARKVGDYTIIDGDSNSYSGDLKQKRDDIVKLVQTDGYKQVIEEFAYTWFNRIIALRFMEVHDFLPHGFRVLSSRDGGIEPEIMKHLDLVNNELNLDLAVIQPLYSQGKLDEAYSYVLFRQCKALSGILPMLFSAEYDYLELLLPKALLKGETFITKLLEIGEDAFLDDVEVIGWLYQFYISQTKDEVFASKATITKDNLPAVTQLFTPDWIVRYMAENSLGRIWLESHPDSIIRNKMPFYIDESIQSDEIRHKFESIKYRNVNPESIKIIEPCCGSGHILVYVFDLLYQMYEEQGYQKRDIPTLILKNNLFGLDVDKRASQLASFSLVMKARTLNSRFFNSDYYVSPKVYEIWDSRVLMRIDYKNQLRELGVLTEEQIKGIEDISELYRYGKIIGSLIKLDTISISGIEESLKIIKEKAVNNIFNSYFLNDGIKCIEHLVLQSKILSDEYDVFITNPPYVNINNLEKVMKDYANDNYPESKTDMFSMFMERSERLIKSNGFSAFLTPYVWMFIQSYEKLRNLVYNKFSIYSIVQLEYNAFEAACVPVGSFVLRKTKMPFKGEYIRLSEFKGIENQMPKTLEAIKNKDCGYRYSVDQTNFFKIPGIPLAYWIDKKIINLFEKNKTLDFYGDGKKGLSTGDNNQFLRLWFEVNNDKISFTEEDVYKTKKWVPLNKGGEFRKWYGNNEYVINWENNGSDIKKFKGSVIRNEQYYLRQSITWTMLSNSCFGVRFSESGKIFEGAGPSYFVHDDISIYYVLGLLCSKLGNMFIRIFNPTMNINIADVLNIPVVIDDVSVIEDISKKCVDIAKSEWDSYEVSWNYKRHPLYDKNQLISDLYDCWNHVSEDRFNSLLEYEDELNKKFIDLYGLKDVISFNISSEDITLRKANKNDDIKSLISYLIGIEMGRYSLDVDGLVFAGDSWNPMNYMTYQPDDDGIIPIYSELGMPDGLDTRIIKLIKHIYGEENYKENIDFIAEALGKNQNESSEETLNRYLNNGFYADHIKTYQKRPIYWMFSSGKNDAFKCLVYLHRYNEDTLAKINSKYFLNESARLNIEVNEMRLQSDAAEGREKLRLDKQMKLLTARQKEMIEYGQVLDHMANKYINLDLDDGVKVNYAKFQGIEVVNESGAKVKKDLLVPIK